MSEHLTCLVSESHLVKIAKNNDVFEKKCQIFEQQRQVLERNMQLSEVCCEQVKRMAHLVDDKRKVLKEDVEKQQQETRKFVKESEELVDATFEKINSIRTQSAPKLDADSIAFLISLAYDEYIQNGHNNLAELSQEVEETSRKHELLTQEREEISRQRDLVDKAIAKAEKENSALKASLARKKEEAAKLDGVRNQKLLEAKKENEAAVKSRVEVEKEVEVARKSAEENRKTIVAIESERDEWRMKIEKIDTMILQMSTDEPLDPALFSTPVDDEELDNLFSEVSEFFESNPPSASEADLETIETLKSILDDTKKQKRAVQKDLEQMRIYSDKFTVTNELLKRKISGLEAAEKQLEENTQLLKSLKANPDKSKGVQSRKSKEDDAIRRLKASANDFPAPIAFPLYPEYQTPQDTRPKSDLKEKNHKKLAKRVSIESESTRPLNIAETYPGIQLLSPAASPKSVDPSTNEPEEVDDLPEDSSTLSLDESGTTQDPSMMNMLFSPLRNENNVQEEPVVEFSMTAHMNDYNKRQAAEKAKKELMRTTMEDENEDDPDDSLMAPVNAKEAVDQTVFSDLSDDSLDESAEDEDDFYAPEGEEMDQSNWGSDD